ncbi:hypothetical protein DPMN_135669 [Dreissena polymorpha]|uniref:Uncharacterized protein n=1 Tax=Dreissena polymorpha TaxID=45954 RepID=A0A9D4G4D3_DREPO|nr:hypothetical protein DPMN_135669 [Dreissena polymorpha]
MDKTTLAAMALLFHTMGLESPTRFRDVNKLVTALIKSRTKQPMKRQRPMPVNAFVELFDQLGPNNQLHLRDLRMKAITLLALCAMTTPSDLAPKGKVFKPEDNSSSTMPILVHEVIF